MSDTPRTDAAYFKPDATMYDLAGEMKRIERELTASNERVRLLISERDTARGYADQKWKLRQEFHDLFGTDDIAEAVALVRGLQDRIKRLEEALEGSLKWIVDIANSGDIGFYNIEEDSEIIAARAALKAKEAKP
jgi:hypothetical protein